jgi:hypothetical protein
MPANCWMNLTMPAVTARACARPAPAAIAGYPGRYPQEIPPLLSSGST